MEQVSSVSQLSDVQPTEWAFQALQSLVERYGCIAGYPDRTFRGNRAITRYEFAAGLNACLDRVNELIRAQVDEAVKPADLETIKRLQQDFAAELATLRGRMDALEAKTAVLERQQFSTTSILGGESIFGLVKGFGGGPPGDGEVNPVLVSTTRLQWNTSFTGRDRLRFELEAGNFSGLGLADPRSLNSLNALLSFQSDTGNNQVLLSTLEYRFAVGDRLVVTARPVGFSLSSVLTANFPYFSDSQGSVSRFGQLSPIFRIGNLDAGVGFDWLLSRRLRFQFAYGANNGSDANDGFLFGKGGHALGAQLLFLPSDTVQIGATFINGYSPDGSLNTFTGSRVADASGFINQPAQIYALNLSLQWEISPKVVFAGWAGLAAAYAADTNAGAASTTFMASLGFRDPFNRKQGDLLAILIGQPLSLLNVSNTTVSTGLVTDNVLSLHAELFYRFRINDNLSITPGFFLVTNPGNFASNNTIYVGTIRSSFRF
ncbi:carbohydrate porin [Cyanobacteria bacterium FACHB-63]|nr:carbohydrate porin [Cyanobacteria bacterium FACHB-63]